MDSVGRAKELGYNVIVFGLTFFYMLILFLRYISQARTNETNHVIFKALGANRLQ